MPTLPISFLSRGGAVGVAVLIALLITLAIVASNNPSPRNSA